jgi:hypothetical protein
MEGPIAIGALALLAGLAIWFGVSEAKSGATAKEAGKAMREVIDAGKRFEKARRESAGMPRRERVYLMLQELRAGSRS